MGSQCSLVLILELWLYSIRSPRAWVIRSITNLKCHPVSGICHQVLPILLEIPLFISPHPLGASSSHGPGLLQEHSRFLAKEQRLCRLDIATHGPLKNAPHPEELFLNLLQLKIEHLRFLCSVQNRDTKLRHDRTAPACSGDRCPRNVWREHFIGSHEVTLEECISVPFDPSD